MPKPGMIQLESAHFSNLTGAVQRTASLPGGAIRGLPGGTVIDGLPGVASFASSISDAQKEHQLGRTRIALERIRQLETSFNGIAGRWNATTSSVIANARQGRNSIGLARLNEVKNAQTRMQQLSRPAEKAFRDLITALEHAISMEGREQDTESNDSESSQPSSQSTTSPSVPIPDEFSGQYAVGTRLQLSEGSDGKTRVVPALRPDALYFYPEQSQARVVKLEKLTSNTITLRDQLSETVYQLKANQIILIVRKGIWEIDAIDH